jgi:hypothetical protein
MTTEEQDLSIEDLKIFSDRIKKTKNANNDFIACLNSETHMLKDTLDKLNTNDGEYILQVLLKFDLNTIDIYRVGRLLSILDNVPQNYLNKYRTYFFDTHIIKELPTKLIAPEPEFGKVLDKDVILEFNKSLKEWGIETDNIIEWNRKIEIITENLNDNITIDLYGDITLDTINLPFVYFKFLNTDIDEIENFIHELRNCQLSIIKKIKTVEIVDIKDKLPSFLKSANEVRVFFTIIEEVEELHGCSDYIGSVYEKYIIKNDTMKKDGGEWGMFNQRKDNLDNPQVGSFSIQTAMNNIVNTPTLNSGDIEEEDSEFYSEDYEVSLSDCIYSTIKLEDGIVAFSIIPSDFYEEYKTILVNPNMFIEGISDNKKWRKHDIYFRYLGTVDEAKEYLDDNDCSSNIELYNSINDVDVVEYPFTELQDTEKEDEDYSHTIKIFTTPTNFYLVNGYLDEMIRENKSHNYNLTHLDFLIDEKNVNIHFDNGVQIFKTNGYLTILDEQEFQNFYKEIEITHQAVDIIKINDYVGELTVQLFRGSENVTKSLSDFIEDSNDCNNITSDDFDKVYLFLNTERFEYIKSDNNYIIGSGFLKDNIILDEPKDIINVVSSTVNTTSFDIDNIKFYRTEKEHNSFGFVKNGIDFGTVSTHEILQNLNKILPKFYYLCNMGDRCESIRLLYKVDNQTVIFSELELVLNSIGIFEDLEFSKKYEKYC